MRHWSIRARLTTWFATVLGLALIVLAATTWWTLHTPPPGQVFLSLRCDDGMAVMDVTDTGIGIGAEDLPHVFDRFYRADRARSRDSGGSGLGLSIAKWIAERHGGRVGIKSAPGLGCRVRVELPCAAPAASPSTSAAVLVEP